MVDTCVENRFGLIALEGLRHERAPVNDVKA